MVSKLLSLSVVVLVLAGCTAPEPNLQPGDVYTRPEIAYKEYKSIVVYVDMKDVPEAQREPAIVSTVHSELRKRGFDIIEHNAYMSFLREKRSSPSESGNRRLLASLKEELGRSAIIRVHVDVFMAQRKMVDRGKIVTPGVPGVREAPLSPLEEGLHNWLKWVIDLSLTIDMIDTSSAAKIWSCSWTCRQSSYEGKVEAFIRKAVAACLDTIPTR